MYRAMRLQYVIYNQLRIKNYGLRITDYGLRITNNQL
jgi:hypothetical protein